MDEQNIANVAFANIFNDGFSPQPQLSKKTLQKLVLAGICIVVVLYYILTTVIPFIRNRIVSLYESRITLIELKKKIKHGERNMTVTSLPSSEESKPKVDTKLVASVGKKPVKVLKLPKVDDRISNLAIDQNEEKDVNNEGLRKRTTTEAGRSVDVHRPKRVPPVNPWTHYDESQRGHAQYSQNNFPPAAQSSTASTVNVGQSRVTGHGSNNFALSDDALLRRQQDAEYEECLRRDRAKMAEKEARKEEERRLLLEEKQKKVRLKKFRIRNTRTALR